MPLFDPREFSPAIRKETGLKRSRALVVGSRDLQVVAKRSSGSCFMQCPPCHRSPESDTHGVLPAAAASSSRWQSEAPTCDTENRCLR